MFVSLQKKSGRRKWFFIIEWTVKWTTVNHSNLIS